MATSNRTYNKISEANADRLIAGLGRDVAPPRATAEELAANEAARVARNAALAAEEQAASARGVAIRAEVDAIMEANPGMSRSAANRLRKSA